MRPHPYRKGTIALREIRRYQGTTDFLISKASFQRLVREILQNIDPHLRIRKEAMLAIQETAESHLVELFKNALQVAIHAKRVTINIHDLYLIIKLK